VDIGTTSVKAVAVDDDGTIVARSRVPHRVLVPAPDQMEHDANRAWRLGPVRALAGLGPHDIRGVGVTAMVPSLSAVDRRGRPRSPGLLYGDGRGRRQAGGGLCAKDSRIRQGFAHNPEEAQAGPEEGPAGPEGSGEVLEFLRWTAGVAPDAHGYWPAQAVANRALGGAAAVDLGVAFTSSPPFGPDGWDKDLCASCGVGPEQLPSVEMPGSPAGLLGGDGPPLVAPSVDVWCEQLVAGAEDDGDVHVICGTTLIVWAVTGEVPAGSPGGLTDGLWRVGHRLPGRQLVGGASNAGGLFLNWASHLLGPRRAGDELHPHRVPVWTPYPRGERTPFHDPFRRAGLHGLDLTHGPAAARRAAFEASAFVVRHHLDLAGVRSVRLVATGGGTRIDGWMQALADATGLPVHVAADPEGAARGAAFLARVAAGLDPDVTGAGRWARTGVVVDPDPRWTEPTAERYARFLELSGATPR
jgi:xylulokinase